MQSVLNYLDSSVINIKYCKLFQVPCGSFIIKCNYDGKITISSYDTSVEFYDCLIRSNLLSKFDIKVKKIFLSYHIKIFQDFQIIPSNKDTWIIYNTIDELPYIIPESTIEAYFKIDGIEPEDIREIRYLQKHQDLDDILEAINKTKLTIIRDTKDYAVLNNSDYIIKINKRTIGLLLFRYIKDNIISFTTLHGMNRTSIS